MTFKYRSTSNYTAGQKFVAKKLGGGGRFYKHPQAAVFNPLSLGSLSAWYKADSLSLGNGATVTSFADSSGTGNDLVDYVGTPTYNSADAQFGGKPSISLDGSSFLYKEYAASLPEGNNAFTVYVAGYASSNTFFGIGGNSNYSGVRLSFVAGGGDTYYVDYCNMTGAGPAAGSNSSPIVLSLSKADAVLTPSVSFYCNNVLGTPGGQGGYGLNLPPQNGAGGITPAYVTIGCIPGYPFVYANGVGKFAEALVYTVQHDDATRLQVTQYLADKYSITI